MASARSEGSNAIDVCCLFCFVFVGILGRAQHGKCERVTEQLRGLPESLLSVRGGLHQPQSASVYECWGYINAIQ